MSTSRPPTQPYLRAAAALLENGVTAYQPTLITAAEETLVAALAEVPSSRNVLGAHLEGPFISPERLGAHPAEAKRDPDRALLERLLAATVSGGCSNRRRRTDPVGASWDTRNHHRESRQLRVGRVTAFADGKIEVYLGPTELGAPDDLEAVIVEFIEGARKSLDIAVQELDNPRIAQAILDARWNGIDVNLFLEQDYLRSELQGKPPKRPKPKSGETPEQALHRAQWLDDQTDLAENRRILAALLRSDIQVRGDYNPKIFHQKFVLRDYRDSKAQPTSALLTGSANFTETDTHRNLNHIVVFNNAFVCRQYETEVEQLRRGSFGRGLHGAIPKDYNLGGVPVKVLFAPDHTPELEFMKQMLKVRTNGTIWFAIFTFAGSSGIDDTMLALARGGVTIRGVLDPGQAKQGWAAPKWLQHPNIQLRIPKRKGVLASLRKVHHKLMVIDNRIVIAGSFNYTAPANEYNDENLFVIGSPHEEVEGITVELDPVRDIATHMRAEIERLYALSEPFVPG